MYLIDSDWVIDHLEDQPDAVRLLASLADDGIAISIVTYMEVFQGVTRSSAQADAAIKLQTFISGVPILPMSVPVKDIPGLQLYQPSP
jgi:predicted nucleic acid-binding protein